VRSIAGWLDSFSHLTVNAPDHFYGGIGDDIYYLYDRETSR
jgi:hypothetical protein